MKGVSIVQEKERRPRINGAIVAREVRVIGVEGEALGILSLSEALLLAEEHRVDLVEVVPNATPPVCRLVDYGKFKYQEAKKLHEVKMKQRVSQIKEVKLRPSTDEFDYQVKVRSLLRFLEEGHIAKVTLRFRGREMAHQELGLRVLERIREELSSCSQVQQMPKLEGRQIVMILTPVKRKV